MIKRSDSSSSYIPVLDIVSVEKDDELLVSEANVLPGWYYGSDSQASIRATTTTDRNLYKEGDTVSIKGYVREFDAKANLLDGKPNKIGSRAYAVVQWLRNEQDSREIVELGEFNEYGAFVGELKVPDSVSCKLIVFLYC